MSLSPLGAQTSFMRRIGRRHNKMETIMIKSLLAFLTTLLLPVLAFAQDKAAEPEPEVSVVWVGVFFLICVVGIVWWVIATAKASKRAEAEKQQ